MLFRSLPTVIYSLAGTSSNSYGYFGGGVFICTISRLDFSNETTSNPGKNLPTARYGLAATSSNLYGYFGGGYIPHFSTITRLDFSNETVSDPGKT